MMSVFSSVAVELDPRLLKSMGAKNIIELIPVNCWNIMKNNATTSCGLHAVSNPILRLKRKAPHYFSALLSALTHKLCIKSICLAGKHSCNGTLLRVQRESKC